MTRQTTYTTERPAERTARIARKRVDPETAAALRRLWGAQ